jgi:hypothetical protein
MHCEWLFVANSKRNSLVPPTQLQVTVEINYKILILTRLANPADYQGLTSLTLVNKGRRYPGP